MKIFLRMMAFILLMLVAWLTSTRRAEHRWVAFMSINVSSFYGDIHLMSEGTSEPYLIQPIAGCVRTPKWSPDGRWLSYKNECTDQQEFLRIRPGGIVPEEITAPIADGVQYMAWSPDGQRVLIERENFDIYIVDADGERLLIKNYLIGDWSPDSEWVYGIPVGQEDDVLERIHAQTGRVEALFSTQDYIFPRSWSPDDQWMVIDRLTDDDDELFISNADGSDLQRITEDFPGEQIASPLWSPDGEWIAFTGGNSSFESHIYRIRPDGRQLETLTDRLDAYSLQGWSPDSQWLYYMVGFTIAPELYRMRADGSSPEKVSFTAKNDAPPQFAPASAADFSPFWLTLAVIGLMILSTIGNLRR